MNSYDKFFESIADQSSTNYDYILKTYKYDPNFAPNYPNDFKAEIVYVPLNKLDRVINYYNKKGTYSQGTCNKWTKLSKIKYNKLNQEMKYEADDEVDWFQFIQRNGFSELYENPNLIGIYCQDYLSDYADISYSRIDAIVKNKDMIIIYRTCFEDLIVSNLIEKYTS